MGKVNFLFAYLTITALFAVKNVCFGEEKVGIYELKRADISVKISNYGATVVSVLVPDRHGKLDDVVLAFGSMDDYKNDTTYFGNIVGRVANRIGGAKFMINGQVYKLPANDHGNTLHGGPHGFSDVVWEVREYVKDSHLTLTYDSYDGEQGFPGNLSVMVTYLLFDNNKFGIKMEAKPLNKPTPVNLASHTYWNLGGHRSGDILSHTIQINAAHITPVDANLIPTGQIVPVEGTAYDFLKPRHIGSLLSEVPGGYDMNYIVNQAGNGTRQHLAKVATVRDSRTGRKMELWSNQVGVQFYTANMLNTTVGKDGAVYKVHDGLCLETQGFPDALNHPNFPSQVVGPGQKYLHVMVYRFTAA